MVEASFAVTVLFYNPNIHPLEEYELRKSENKAYATKMGVPFVDADYDVGRWFSRVEGLGAEPERGARCSVCFDIRFERTSAYAVEHGFRWYTSCLAISRWKDYEQITRMGNMAAARHTGLSYWDINFRKKGGSQRMISLAKQEGFYQQEYCGCVYSYRDTNHSRRERGLPRIKRGITFYSESPSQKKDQGPSCGLGQHDSAPLPDPS